MRNHKPTINNTNTRNHKATTCMHNTNTRNHRTTIYNANSNNTPTNHSHAKPRSIQNVHKRSFWFSIRGVKNVHLL